MSPEFVPAFIGIVSTPNGRGYWVLAGGEIVFCHHRRIPFRTSPIINECDAAIVHVDLAVSGSRPRQAARDREATRFDAQ